MKKLFIAPLLFSLTAFSNEKPKTYTFIAPKASCTLIDGALVLTKGWPLGSWEDCAYAILTVAQQLDAMKDTLTKQLADEKAKPVPTCTPAPKPGK